MPVQSNKSHPAENNYDFSSKLHLLQMETDTVVILSEHGSISQNALKFCFIKRLLDGGEKCFSSGRKRKYTKSERCGNWLSVYTIKHQK